MSLYGKGNDVHERISGRLPWMKAELPVEKKSGETFQSHEHSVLRESYIVELCSGTSPCASLAAKYGMFPKFFFTSSFSISSFFLCFKFYSARLLLSLICIFPFVAFRVWCTCY